MSEIIASFSSENFVTHAVQHDDKTVTFNADADVDADGANGQNGSQAAYMVNDVGSEYLANGGMKMEGGKVVFAESWGRDIVIHEEGALGPKVFPGGVIASKTAYLYKGVNPELPEAYVDSENVNYVVVPPEIRQHATGVVLGCKVVCVNCANGKTAEGIVADIGPRHKIGEISIAMARALGIPSSPRHGGVSTPTIQYTLFPDVHGEVNGKKIALLSASGDFILPVDEPAEL